VDAPNVAVRSSVSKPILVDISVLKCDAAVTGSGAWHEQRAPVMR